jgi:hypothetical protein
MATKYPFASTRKQVVLSIGLDLLHTREGLVPVVATAELGSFTVFWFADGKWKSWGRPHVAQDRRTIRPDQLGELNWSQQVAVAAGRGFVALVYKRSLKDGDTPSVYIDVLEWRDSDHTLVPTRPQPFAVPLDALRLIPQAFDLWAEWRKDQLAIVLQASPFQLTFGHQLGPHTPIQVLPPHLVYLSVGMKDAQNSQLEDTSAWTRILLDQGGYDFDVLRDGEQLYCVHRRRAETVSVNFANGGALGFLIGNPQEPSSGNALPKDVYAPLALVRLDLASGDPNVVADNIGIGDHPQIHRANPFVVTADVTYWLISANQATAQTLITPTPLQTVKQLIMQAGNNWVQADFMDADQRFFPFHLFDFSRGQYLVSLDQLQCGLATLLRTHQVLLVQRENRPQKKDQRLVFLHDGLVASYFSVATNSAPPELLIQGEGSSVWDINYRPIPIPGLQELFDEGENTQFRVPGNVPSQFSHEDGFKVQSFLPVETATGLGGALTGKKGNPAIFYAYVDRGDCGPRVMFTPGKVVSDPRAPNNYKNLKPEFVEPGTGAGMRWVKFTTPDFVATHLPGYPAPQLFFDLPGPRAAASRIVALIDTLERFVTVTINGNPSDAPVQNPLNITQVTAGNIQDALLSTLSVGPTVAQDTPFHVQFSYAPGMLFVMIAYTFTASTGGNDSGFQFKWTIEDLGQNAPPPTVLNGNVVTHTFARDGDHRLTLQVTRADGTVSQLEKILTVMKSVWGLLTQVHDQISPTDPTQPGAKVGDATVDISKYDLSFAGMASPTPSLNISFKPEHQTLFRCDSVDAGQGVVRLRMPVTAKSKDVTLAGSIAWLSAFVTVNNVEIGITYERPFTPGVLMSDRRSLGSLTQTDTNEQTIESQTALAVSSNLPSGLACKPIAPGTLHVDKVVVSLGLSALSSGSVEVIVGVLLNAGLGPLLIASILSIAPGLAVLVAAATLPVLVAAIAAAGLTQVLLFAWAPQWLSSFATGQVKHALITQAGSIASAMDGFGLAQYAGEALAETLAREAIKAARAQGANIPAPTDDGFNRARPDLFDMIVVTDKECMVLMRC